MNPTHHTQRVRCADCKCLFEVHYYYTVHAHLPCQPPLRPTITTATNDEELIAAVLDEYQRVAGLE